MVSAESEIVSNHKDLQKRSKHTEGDVGMLTHVVLFKLKDRSAASIERTKQVLMNMENKIPVLKHLEVGTDMLHLDRSYDLALIAKFDQASDLQSYDDHPLHLEVKAHMKQVLDGSSICVDFES